MVDREPVSGHLGPPASTPADLAAPAGLKDTKPSSEGVDFPLKLHLAPESLDPRALKLLWRQRELEIQALRGALQQPQSARRGRILQEVAGFPFERSSHSQKKLLQTQVQKLTLELKEQKEQAQLEKVHLEEQLLHTKQLLQQVQTELQALEKSCLLQLARSSWIGRMLRSSTGSVEVVTAETLIDPSDLSENDEVPPAQDSFRLEDVDWNSVAHRYPNLFTATKPNLDYKHLEPQPPTKQPVSPAPEERGSEPSVHQAERSFKSVEWRPLPLEGTSSSGGADSDSSSPQLDPKSRVQKVTGHLPWAPGHTSEQTKPQAGGCRRASQAESEGRCRPVVLTPDVPDGHSKRGSTSPTGVLFLDQQETDLDSTGKMVPACSTDSDSWRPGHQWSPPGSCLKIAAVSRREKSVRIVNESLEETADLGGFALQQLRSDFPVRMYRFPPHTLLAPQHHVTVWGEGPGSTQKQPPSSPGRGTVHFQSSRGCVTLLLSPKGEVLSKHQAPHCVTQVSKAFDDNTDWSIDRFQLPDAQPGANAREQRCQPRLPRDGRVREARVEPGSSGPPAGAR
uniref:Lamin tail domain containing 2 n=1 Tax=Rousettus aegyptiacus TaxID=9407 RepID=A0A7J8H0T4_ROUAE|nr:lamin tail domain containing 2 [Rousettus aegyptiacus]